jgi:integrase
MGVDVPLSCINSELILAYEAYLKRAGVCLNTSSFYLRNLRAVYNRAVDLGLVEQQYPFKYVYTGVCKTIKRAISLDVIKKIKALDLSTRPTLDFARDMFLFSFYTRGMSFIDMAYLRKKDLCGNVLSYRRRKTGQQLFIRWEKCMHDLLKKYDTSNSIYLLPILKPAKDLDIRKQYQYSAHNINHSLQIIGDMLGIRLTLYVARHSWASIARNKQIPISIISEALGHDSEQTTRIYLSSLESNTIDKANCMILKLLQ